MMRWVVVGCAREGKFRNFTLPKRGEIQYTIIDSEAERHRLHCCTGGTLTYAVDDTPNLDGK